LGNFMLWIALLALEVPCAMPMCPARHNDVPECGEIGRWHNLEQFYCRGPVCAIEEANTGVLRPSEGLQGCKCGIVTVNWAYREFLLFFFLQSHYIGTYIAWALHCAVPGTSIWRVVPWHKLW